MRNLLGVPNMLTAYLLLAKVSSLILRAAADCGAENTLKTGDVIQCRECSYHILYKKRTCRTMTQLEEEGTMKKQNQRGRKSAVTLKDCLEDTSS
ncbi:unnamed protein product [Urochloa humidicola]